VFLGHCNETRGERWTRSHRLHTSVHPRCMHAYIVSAHGARRLSDLAREIRMDGLNDALAKLCSDGNLSCLSAWPPLAHQGTLESTHDGSPPLL
jgi:hypothetical protein